jgi:hypothetical protein
LSAKDAKDASEAGTNPDVFVSVVRILCGQERTAWLSIDVVGSVSVLELRGLGSYTQRSNSIKAGVAMRFHHVAGLILFGLTITSMAVAAPDCSIKSVPQPLPLRPTALPSMSEELPSGSHQLGAPDGLLAYQSDEAEAVDRVLLRLRQEGCQSVSKAAAYVPRTKWDNTPYRFNAGGNGKKFTAADFDAWMKANGIHVSKGVPTPVQPAPAPTDATPPPNPSTPTN